MKVDWITKAAEAHTNLNTFHCVISLLEGGHLYGDHRAAARIIAIAKKQAGIELRKYDAAARAARKEG